MQPPAIDLLDVPDDVTLSDHRFSLVALSSAVADLSML